MILIDANALILLIVGLIDQNLISSHKRTSQYSKQDFKKLLLAIGNFNRLVVLPNVWTEVDNLLNNFSGDYKAKYVLRIRELILLATERYLKSSLGTNNHHFVNIGLTDSLLIESGKSCNLLITADSALTHIARAYNIKVYDLVEEKNKNFRK